MRCTGRKLKYMLETAGYKSHIIKDYFHLSCVLPIYRWYKGVILPSVAYLLMLSELLNVQWKNTSGKEEFCTSGCYRFLLSSNYAEIVNGISSENKSIGRIDVLD